MLFPRRHLPPAADVRVHRVIIHVVLMTLILCPPSRRKSIIMNSLLFWCQTIIVTSVGRQGTAHIIINLSYRCIVLGYSGASTTISNGIIMLLIRVIVVSFSPLATHCILTLILCPRFRRKTTIC